MRRLLVTLLLAHVIGSYGALLTVTYRYGRQGPEAWLLAPAWALVAMWDVTTHPSQFKPRWATVATVDGSYALCFLATVACRYPQHRRTLQSRRRRTGLCTECGYDLTGNASGKCPECGILISRKARLLVRRSR